MLSNAIASVYDNAGDLTRTTGRIPKTRPWGSLSWSGVRRNTLARSRVRRKYRLALATCLIS